MLSRDWEVETEAQQADSTYRSSPAKWASGWEKKARPFAFLLGALVALCIGIQGAWSWYTDGEQYSGPGIAFWCGGSLVLTVLLARLGIKELRVQRDGDLQARRAKEPRYDSVTGLPTGRLFKTLVDEALSQAERGEASMAILLLDLEQIQLVSERRGSTGGDSALRVLAARIKGSLHGADTVARLRGDQFAVLLRGTNSPEKVAESAQKIFQRVIIPMIVHGEEILVNSCMGIALYPVDGSSWTDLITHAREAMESAKSQGLPIFFATADLNSQVFGLPSA